jgi:hypothetical protein
MPPPRDMLRACANMANRVLVFVLFLGAALMPLRPTDVSMSGVGSAYSNASTSLPQIQVLPRLYPSTVACIDAHQYHSASSRTIEVVVRSPTTVNFATPTAPDLVVQVSAKYVDYLKRDTDIHQQMPSLTPTYSTGYHAGTSARRSSSPTTGSATLLATATPSTAATPSSSTTTPVAPTDHGYQAQLDAQLRDPALMQAFWAAFHEMGRGQVANDDEVQLTPRGHDDVTQHETYNLVHGEPDDMHEEMDWPGAPQRAHSDHLHLERHDTAFAHRRAVYYPPQLAYHDSSSDFAFGPIHAQPQHGGQRVMTDNGQGRQMVSGLDQANAMEDATFSEQERVSDPTRLQLTQDGTAEDMLAQQEDRPSVPSTHGSRRNHREGFQHQRVRRQVLLLGISNHPQLQPQYDPPVIDPADHMSSESLSDSRQSIEVMLIANSVLQPRRPTKKSKTAKLFLDDGGEAPYDGRLKELKKSLSQSEYTDAMMIFFSRNEFCFEHGSDKDTHPAWLWIKKMTRELREAGTEHFSRITLRIDLSQGDGRCRLDSTNSLLDYIGKMTGLEQLTIAVDGSAVMKVGTEWSRPHERVFEQLKKLNIRGTLRIDYDPPLEELDSRMAELKAEYGLRPEKDGPSGSGQTRKSNRVAEGKATKKRKVD